MKVTIEQPKLAALISRVIGAVERRNTVPILANIKLTATDTLQAEATDLDLTITASSEAEVSQPGSTTVSAALISSIVSKLPKGKLITLTEADQKLTITCGKSCYDLATLDVRDFPAIANDTYESTFTAPAMEIKRLLEMSAFAMSTEETRYYLNGIYVHSHEGKARAVATDGHRLAQVDSDVEADIKGVIIPRKTVGELRKLLVDGDATVSVSETKIRVESDGVSIISKVIDGVFPDYARIIPRDFNTEVIADAAEMKGAAERASLVSGDKTKAVKITVADNECNLEVRHGADVAVEEIEVEQAGPDITVGINSKYASDILQQCLGDKAIMRFNTASDPVVFMPGDDDKCLMLCMPLRV